MTTHIPLAVVATLYVIFNGVMCAINYLHARKVASLYTALVFLAIILAAIWVR